jgi:hypothetical protein
VANRTKEVAAVVGFGVLGIGLLVVLFSSDFYDLDRAKARAQPPSKTGVVTPAP